MLDKPKDQPADKAAAKTGDRIDANEFQNLHEIDRKSVV